MRVPPPEGVEVYVIRYRPPGADPGAVALAELWPARARYTNRLRLDTLIAKGPEAITTEAWVEAYVTGCIGTLTGLELADGTPLRDGATLWALRDRVHPDLVEELVSELSRRIVADREARAATEAQRQGFTGPSSSPASPPPSGGTASPVAATGSAA